MPEKLQCPYPMICMPPRILMPHTSRWKTWFHKRWKSFPSDKMLWVIIICKRTLITHTCIGLLHYLLQSIPTERRRWQYIYFTEDVQRSCNSPEALIGYWLPKAGWEWVCPINPAQLGPHGIFRMERASPVGLKREGLRKVLARRRNMLGWKGWKRSKRRGWRLFNAISRTSFFPLLAR